MGDLWSPLDSPNEKHPLIKPDESVLNKPSVLGGQLLTGEAALVLEASLALHPYPKGHCGNVCMGKPLLYMVRGTEEDWSHFIVYLLSAGGII